MIPLTIANTHSQNQHKHCSCLFTPKPISKLKLSQVSRLTLGGVINNVQVGIRLANYCLPSPNHGNGNLSCCHGELELVDSSGDAERLGIASDLQGNGGGSRSEDCSPNKVLMIAI